MSFFLFIHQDGAFKSKIAMFNNSGANVAKEPPADPFQTEDPFKSFSGQSNFLTFSIVSACIKVITGLIFDIHIIVVVYIVYFSVAAMAYRRFSPYAVTEHL